MSKENTFPFLMMQAMQQLGTNFLITLAIASFGDRLTGAGVSLPEEPFRMQKTVTDTGTGLVAATTLAEIQDLQLVDNDGNVTDFPVPTLQEALEWAEGRTILELDLKSDDFLEEVVQIITDLEAEDQTRFITQNLEQAIGIYALNPEIHLGLLITADNQAEVLAGIAAAPFGFANVSAFTGTRPQTATFYDALHDEGIVVIQGLFGNQDFFGEETFIDDLTDKQRTELFETVYARGADVIASDFSQPISELLD
ncbi:MAG: glycerophosphodiester phosphodiesterase family protein [Cyanobacteria bacterium J06639_14]